MLSRPESGKIFLVRTTKENQAQKEAYRDEFVKRTKKVREDSGYSAPDIAVLLGIPYDLYRKYEKGTVMPHHLIPRFLAVTRGDCNYLLGMSTRNKRLKLVAVD